MINKKAFPNYSERLFYLLEVNKNEKVIILSLKFNPQSLIHNTHSSFLTPHSFLVE